MISEENELLNIHKNKANIFFNNKDYESALSIYNTLISIDDNITLLSNRSLIFFKLNKFQACIDDAVKVIKVNKNNHRVWGRLGGALCGLERYEEALVAYNKAYELSNFDFYNEMIKRIELKMTTKKIDFNNIKDNLYDNDIPKIDNIVNNLMNNKNILSKLNDTEFQNKILSYQNNPLAALKDNSMMELMNDIMSNL